MRFYVGLGGTRIQIRPSVSSMNPTDKNVESVRAKLHERMLRGLSKYGVTTERTDYSRKDWLVEAQNEALDLAVYLEKLIQMEP